MRIHNYPRRHLVDLISDIDDSAIQFVKDFTPSWNIRKKRKFLNTIINGFDVPKFYFYQENKKHHVIDGMERLLSIIEFIDEEYDLGDMKFNLLPEIKISKFTYPKLKQEPQVNLSFNTYLFDIKSMDCDIDEARQTLKLVSLDKNASRLDLI